MKVLNINLDKKLEDSGNLLPVERVYAVWLTRFGKYAAEYKDINRAAEQAVTECIEENILAEFPEKESNGGDRGVYFRI